MIPDIVGGSYMGKRILSANYDFEKRGYFLELEEDQSLFLSEAYLSSFGFPIEITGFDDTERKYINGHEKRCHYCHRININNSETCNGCGAPL